MHHVQKGANCPWRSWSLGVTVIHTQHHVSLLVPIIRVNYVMTLSQPIAPTQMKHCWVPSFTETGTSLGLSDGSRDLVWEVREGLGTAAPWARPVSSVHHRSSIRGMTCTHGLYVCTQCMHVHMCTCKKPPTCTCVCQLMCAS